VSCGVELLHVGAERYLSEMTTASIAQQEKAVAEGLALGATMLDLPSIGGSKQSLESDFGRAWRNWRHRDRFLAIKAGPLQYSILRVLGKSATRSGPRVAYWTGDWPFVPVLENPEWGFDGLAEHIDEGITASAWMELVGAWQSRPPR